MLAPSSMYFLALSQAPPEVAMKMRHEEAGDQGAGEETAQGLRCPSLPTTTGMMIARAPGQDHLG